MKLLVISLCSYLLGSVPVGLLIARWKGVDIRSVGSGNIGATNVFRSVSKILGIITFIADALKGFIPAFLFPLFISSLGEDTIFYALLFGCSAIIGHTWPIYLKFKGGKGMATSAGVLLAVCPNILLVGFIFWVVLFLSTRYVSLASIVSTVIATCYSWYLGLFCDHQMLIPSILTLLCILIIYRHRSNIKRLVQGSENRFVFSCKKK